MRDYILYHKNKVYEDLLRKTAVVYLSSAPLMPPTETLLNCLSETPI
jgi:hypothetical protein